MSDSTFTVKEYNREAWTLADLRAIVAELGDETEWPDASEMSFVSFNGGTRSSSGSMRIRAEN